MCRAIFRDVLGYVLRGVFVASGLWVIAHTATKDMFILWVHQP
jgi:hypothetical protein